MLALLFGVVSIAAGTPCTDVCQGLSCDTPLVCLLVQGDPWQCECPQCREGCGGLVGSSRRQLAENETESCPCRGMTCDYINREVEVLCRDLEDPFKWLTSTGCECGECECATAFAAPVGPDACFDAWIYDDDDEKLAVVGNDNNNNNATIVVINVETEADLRDYLGEYRRSACESLPVGVVVEANLSIGEVVVSGGSRAMVAGGGARNTTLRGSSSTRLLRLEEESALRVEGLSIVGGYGDDLGGGCVLVMRSASLVLRDVEVSDCAAEFMLGGGILGLPGSHVALLGRTRIRRSVAAMGGGVAVTRSGLLLVRDDVIIEDSNAQVAGGGVFVMSDVNATLAGFSQVLNCASIQGGCVFAYENATLDVRGHASLRLCSAAQYGGGIGSDRGTNIVVREQARIADSAAGTVGGGIFAAKSSSLSLADEAVVENARSENGGCVATFFDAIVVIRGAATVRNCSATLGGAGLLLFAGVRAEILENSRILDCHAVESGGAILLFATSSLYVDGAITISRSSAQNGGAIYTFSDASVVLEGGGRIAGCESVDGGGGVAATIGSSVIVRNNFVVTDCWAGGDGGGIFASSSTRVSLSGGSLLANNSAAAGDGGGAYLSDGCEGRVASGSAIVGNSAPLGAGGGVYAGDALVTLRAAPLVGNSAAYGGALAAVGSTARLFVSPAACQFVALSLDFTSPSSVAIESRAAIVALDPAFDHYGLDAVLAGTSEVVELEAVGGHVVETAACLPNAASRRVHAYSGTSSGWNGGHLEWELVDTRQSGLVDVPASVHAVRVDLPDEEEEEEAAAAAADVEEEESLVAAAFESNEALRDGGGLFVSSEATAFVHGVAFRSNRANRGGGVFVDALSRFGASEILWEANSAHLGGGVSASTLSETTISDSVATRNLASDDGGFGYFDNVETLALESTRLAFNRASRGHGGALVVDGGTSTILTTTVFQNNSAAASGGAVAAIDATVSVENSSFFGNSAAASGGAVYARDSAVTFVHRECWDVAIATDMTNTTAACVPIPYLNLEYTCDYWQVACSKIEADLTGSWGPLSCAGCACFGGNRPARDDIIPVAAAERYVAVSSSLDDSEVHRTTPRAAAVRLETACLRADDADYEVRAVDLLGDKWWGGRFGVKIGERFYEGPAFEEGVNNVARAPPIRLSLDSEPPLTTTIANRAGGGGGAVYYDGLAPFGAWASKENQAAYGPDLATPPRSIRLVPGSYVADSGRSPRQALRVELVDETGQRAPPLEGATAIARTSDDDDDDDDASVRLANTLAQFVDGVATFETLEITTKPGKNVSLELFTAVGSLANTSTTATVRVAGCASNEIEEADRCDPCEEGEYLYVDTCVSCSNGMVCEAGTALETLAVEGGWWRPAVDSPRVYECLSRDACPGGGGPETTGFDGCGEGYTGARCAACRARWYHADGVARRCARCSASGRFLAIFVYVLFFILLVCFAIWITFSTFAAITFTSFAVAAGSASSDLVAVAQQARGVDIDDATLAGAPLFVKTQRVIVKVKALLSFYQVIANLPIAVGDLELPNAYAIATSYVADASSFMFVRVLPLRCLVAVSNQVFYLRGVLAATLTPFALLVLLCLLTRFKKRLRGQLAQSDKELASQLMLLVVHLTLPMTSLAAFQTLSCNTYDFGAAKGERSFLRVAPRVSCDGKLYKRVIRTWGLLSIAVYPVGVPALYAVVLFSARNALYFNYKEVDDRRSDSACQLRRRESSIRTEGIWAWRVLWQDYLPRCFYWEVVATISKVLLTGVISIIKAGNPIQLVVGFLIALFFAACQNEFKPFVFDDDDLLASTAHLAAALTFFLLLLLKLDVVKMHAANVALFGLAVIPLLATLYVVRWLLPARHALVRWLLSAGRIVASFRRTTKPALSDSDSNSDSDSDSSFDSGNNARALPLVSQNPVPPTPSSTGGRRDPQNQPDPAVFLTRQTLDDDGVSAASDPRLSRGHSQLSLI